ncbi:glycosyltransferase [Microbacterium excoecariae]|uniref:glycosyltransferase n=1 Tax=Microbacterium excoecariae TaxID=2715210 RepID=UPI00140BB405|nr:glycosyltransferase [Microbacterium excoecariae]NHI16914.1 glycosyltransferase family 4 protein [Microbacterium excoecariae]
MTAPAPHIGYVLKMYPRFSETFVVTEILAREEAGERLRIYSMRPPADPHFHAALARVAAPVVPLPVPRSAASQWAALARARDLPGFRDAVGELAGASADDAAQAIDLALRARADGVTHLHAHFASMATTIARLASLLAGIPYSFTAHAKDLFHDSVDDADVARKVAGAHHVVTVSDYNRRHLERVAGPGHTVHRVYNGVDVREFCPTDAAREVDVVAVGRLVEKKGFEVLIDAIAHLRAAGRETTCRIIGRGEREEQLAARIADRGVGDLVRLVGAATQDGVRDEVARARVFAAPCVVGADGNADGLPTVLLEAMALGTPCVSTPVTGIPEAVVDGETGVLVEPGNVSALACALAGLLDDPAGAGRMADRARARVEAEFSSERQAAALRALVASGEAA